ncbi:LCP family protein [Microbacterium sp. STN6]|uniref:LCP family protein n=1 Tax=Microbacterium sp. STN6 TaxID=2995588 RepID=UPI002260AC57|nr:LCP family protein [Microbacterium sp. STN6]MCX7522475.1 LCP family protein [Microbacterium sp. STN6]
MSDLGSRRRRRMREGIARHGRLKTTHPLASIAKVLASVVAVVLVSSVTVAGVAVWDVARSSKPSVQLEHLDGKKVQGPVPQIGAIDGGVNLLLVGTDTRTGQGGEFSTKDQLDGSSGAGLNDVTMLMHISQDHSNVEVVSFPRDTFVPIPSCPRADGKGRYSSMTSQKLNSTLIYGGLPCTVLTIEKLTGLDIPFAAEISFDGVIAMSNAVGGVPVCVADKIEDRYTGTFLDPGMHKLMGNAALQFLRTRHGVGDGSDLGRISNQQVFMSSLVRTAKSSDTLTNPTKLYGLAKAAVNNMVLSESLNNVNTMVQIALALKDIDLDKVVFIQYPTKIVDGGVVPITYAANALFEAIGNDQPVKLTGGTAPGKIGSIVETPSPSATDSADSSTTPPATTDTGTGTTTDAAGAVELPDSVTGQTSAQVTCSNGRTLRQQ